VMDATAAPVGQHPEPENWVRNMATTCDEHT